MAYLGEVILAALAASLDPPSRDCNGRQDVRPFSNTCDQNTKNDPEQLRDNYIEQMVIK